MDSQQIYTVKKSRKEALDGLDHSERDDVQDQRSVVATVDEGGKAITNLDEQGDIAPSVIELARSTPGTGGRSRRRHLSAEGRKQFPEVASGFGGASRAPYV